MAKPELLGEVKKLISMGKEKGFLTYDELNSTLPAEVVSSEQFGSIMTMFGEMDIEIVDAPEGERIRKARDSEDLVEDAEDVEVEAGAGAGSGEENEKEEISLPAHSAGPTTRYDSISRRWGVWRC
jgi:RNA polymerase primary sigma factor